VPLPSLSIFFPAYNDAPALPRLVEQAFRHAAELSSDFEVVVVNDASPDNTDEVLAELAQKFGPRLRMVRHATNQGYGGALKSGFAAASKEFVFYTDGDAQYDLADLPSLAARMEPGIGMVNGYKISRSDAWYRVLIGKVYLFTVRHLFWLKIHDVDCDFRLIRASALAGLELTSSSGAICVELVRRIQDTGCGIVEVPVRHLPRLHGSSQFFRFRNLWRTLTDVAGLFWVLMILRRGHPEQGRASAVASRPAGATSAVRE
jgi:glycosyltransferase involved in cell wall biosynthesis